MVAILEAINNVNMLTKERIIDVDFRSIEKTSNIMCESQFSFVGGNFYGIKCNHAECGWGVSYLLSGRAKLLDEQVVINGNRYESGETIEEGWYIGEGIKRRKGIFEKTVRQQIRVALKKSGKEESVDDIIAMFGLSEDRVDLKFSNLSWESWRASVAIGYAYGKCVFCFPWLDTAYLKDIIFNTGFGFYIDILRREGKIILLPTADSYLLEKVTNQVIEIKSSRFHEYRFIDEYIENGYNLCSTKE